MSVKSFQQTDYVIPEFMSSKVYVVSSLWVLEKKAGITFVEESDPRSFFYGRVKFGIREFRSMDDMKNYHLKMCKELDWRMKRKKGD